MMTINASVGQALVALCDFSYIFIFIADKSERATEEESPQKRRAQYMICMSFQDPNTGNHRFHGKMARK